jgi:hypothetical protein
MILVYLKRNIVYNVDKVKLLEGWEHLVVDNYNGPSILIDKAILMKNSK